MTINNTEIVNVIESINTEYNKSTTSTHYAILYSKLAIIEFCGWIEQTFDEILTEYVSTKILADNAKYIQEKVINPNYGFHYEKNFRKMMMTVIGIANTLN